MENENKTSAVTTRQDKDMEFVPFGAADKIKLSVSIIQNLVAVPTRTGKTCSEKDALKFMMLCRAQRLNPFAGDAYLVGYDTNNGPTFSLITAHQAFLKRAESSEDYDGMESGIIILLENGSITEREGDFHLPTEKVVGGWARVHHKKHSKPTYRRIRMDRFNKGFAQWKEDPAGMIVKCAEADALRSTFPTLLGGLYMKEELEDPRQPATQMATPIFQALPANATTPPVNDADEPGEKKTDEPAPTTTVPEAETLRTKCGHAGIAESALIGLLTGMGSIAKATTFEEADQENPKVLGIALAQFDRLAAELKSTKK